MKNKRPDSNEQELQENEQEITENGAENAEHSKETQENQKKDAEKESEQTDQQQQVEAMKKKYLYLLSDFENFKRNVAKERIELQQTAGRDIVTALLPVLDDFDRAAKNQALNDGTKLIHHKLQQTMQSFGLTELPCKSGDEFSMDTQEAVAEIPAPSSKLKGKIVEVIEKGYKLGERIIRYTKVVVGK